MKFNNDPEWLRKRAEAEDGCDCTTGSSVGWNENVWNGPGVSPMPAPSPLVFRMLTESRKIRVTVPADVIDMIAKS